MYYEEKIYKVLNEALDGVPDISKADHKKIERLFSFADVKQKRGNGGIASIIDMGSGYFTGRGEKKGGSMLRLVISRNTPEDAYYVRLDNRENNKNIKISSDIEKLDDAIKYALDIGKKAFNKIKNEK